jgi:hypothetical protein
VWRSAGVYRLVFQDSFSCVYSPSFSGGDTETDNSAFAAESRVRLNGTFTGTANQDEIQIESLMLAKDDTGQTGPSPIPRFGDGNRSEEKECKLL